MEPLKIQPNTQLESHLRFKTLLTEISTFFIHLPADKIDSQIENAQAQVCKSLGLDRSTLFQVPAKEPGVLHLTHFPAPGETSTP